MGISHPFAFIQSGWKHRQLIRRLAWRKIEARYRGSVLGLFWSILNPVIMLCTYTLVFSVVFKAKWGGADGGNAEFALYLFSGLIIYTIFAECVNEAPGLMLANKLYIEQLVFPIEILPWVSLLGAIFNFSFGCIILASFYTILEGMPPTTALYLPVVVMPILIGTLGIAWILSSLGVFLRDIQQVIGVVTTVLLFLSPIFYPITRIPESLRPYYQLNPFAGLLEMSRGVLFYGTSPDWVVLASITAGAWFLAWFGFAWFMKTKKGFADVL